MQKSRDPFPIKSGSPKHPGTSLSRKFRCRQTNPKLQSSSLSQSTRFEKEWKSRLSIGALAVRKQLDWAHLSLLVIFLPPWHCDKPNSSNWPVGINSKAGNLVVGWVGVGGLVAGNDGDFEGDLVGSGLVGVVPESGGLLVGARVGILIPVTCI